MEGGFTFDVSTLTSGLSGYANSALTAVVPIVAVLIGARLAISLVKKFAKA